MYRYLAIVWNPLNVAAARTLETCRTAAFKQPQWSVAYQGAGMLALQVDASRGAATAHILQQGAGVVLCTVFERNRTDYSVACPVQLDETQSRRIVDTAGQHLIDKIVRITSLAKAEAPMEDRLVPPNKVQSALQQLATRPRIRGTAA